MSDHIWITNESNNIHHTVINANDLSKLLLKIYDNLKPDEVVINIFISNDNEMGYWIADIYSEEAIG